MYKSIDTTLLRTKQLDELVSRIMLFDYYREELTNVDEGVTSSAEYLASEESDTTPR